MTEEDKKQKFREEFPLCAESADLFRQLFGPGVKLLYAEENGKHIGRQYDEEKHEAIYGKKINIQRGTK